VAGDGLERMTAGVTIRCRILARVADPEISMSVDDLLQKVEDDRKACPHMNFDCNASVGRISKGGEDPDVIVAYTADIIICCHDCGQPFEFLGLPFGMSFYRPTMSINGQRACLPLAIPGTEPPPGLAGFSVTHQVFEEKAATRQ
jgi:hypothetical protein